MSNINTETSKQPGLFVEPCIRKAWVEACEFHPMTNGQVLGEVVNRAKETRPSPVVLLDLDSTLYEVGPRTFQILQEWLAHAESRSFPRVREAIALLRREQVGYSLMDTWSQVGLSDGDAEVKEALKSAKKFWGARFFTNEYLDHDHAYPGAPEFVQNLYQTGAEIIYLTGRDEPGMGQGTRKRLIADKFPWDVDRTHLLLKKNFELDDLEHKQAAADYVKRIGSLVASFENEPPNLVALSEIFPAAMHVFMDTVYSDRPAMPKKGLYRITSFRI